MEREMDRESEWGQETCLLIEVEKTEEGALPDFCTTVYSPFLISPFVKNYTPADTARSQFPDTISTN